MSLAMVDADVLCDLAVAACTLFFPILFPDALSTTKIQTKRILSAPDQ